MGHDNLDKFTNLIWLSRICGMNRDGMTWIHIKHRALNSLNHLVSPGSVKCKLKMGDHDSEITPEAAKDIKHSVKGKI